MIHNRKGFTMAELLIVVAIIAILVSIVVVAYGAMLERSRESAEISNIRTAVNEVITQYLTNGEVITKQVSVTQRQEGWQTEPQPSVTVNNELFLFDAKTSGEYAVSIEVDPSTQAIKPKIS